MMLRDHLFYIIKQSIVVTGMCVHIEVICGISMGNSHQASVVMAPDILMAFQSHDMKRIACFYLALSSIVKPV